MLASKVTVIVAAYRPLKKHKAKTINKIRFSGTFLIGINSFVLFVLFLYKFSQNQLQYKFEQLLLKKTQNNFSNIMIYNNLQDYIK